MASRATQRNSYVGRVRRFYFIYTYHERKAQTWWQQQQAKLQRFNNLKVIHINADGIDQILQRSMQLQCNIQDGIMYFSDDEQNLSVTMNTLAM